MGQKAPNAWGLHDVHGNVLEWVQDCWHWSYAGAPVDGSAWLENDGGDCGRRVVRSGSWSYLPERLRSPLRLWNNAVNWFNFLGFRLAQDL